LYNNIATPTALFGSLYETGKTFYSVHVATEKSLLWTTGNVSNYSTTLASDNTNAQGYNILASNSLYQGLDGLTAYDLQSSQVLSGSSNSSSAATNSPWVAKNTVAPYVNTWSTSSATLTNTLAAQGFVLNTVGV
jgi:hypothetical protein